MGVAKTSMNRIAAEAEVSIGTVYRYLGRCSATFCGRDRLGPGSTEESRMCE
ncbi:TetR/AcrR family transcriptional regulator [Nocardia sp. NPDC003979]